MRNPINQRLPFYYCGTSQTSEELMTLRKQCTPAMAPFPIEKSTVLPEWVIRRQYGSTATPIFLRIIKVGSGPVASTLLSDTAYTSHNRESVETWGAETFRTFYRLIPNYRMRAINHISRNFLTTVGW